MSKIQIRRLWTGLLVGVLCSASPVVFARQDVVLLLNSAGIQGRNAQGRIVRALSDFVNSRAPDTRIALITYGTTPTLLVALTGISNTTRHAVSGTLRHLNYGGQETDSAAGLEQALAEIINHGHSKTQRAIILITRDLVSLDSRSSDQDRLRWIMRSLVPAAVYNHIRIYGIALPGSTDYTELQTLTLETGGESFEMKNLHELVGIFQHISVSLMEAGTMPTREVTGIGLMTAPPPALRRMNPGLFNRSVISAGDHSVSRGWLWLVALLALVAACVGIYAAWNMRPFKPVPTYLMPETVHGDGPRAVLYDVSNSNDIKRFELTERATILGRVAGYDPEVQYVLIKEKTVGRCHAVIERRGHSFWIMDQGSINGTFVNGERITADRALKHADIIAIHRHEFEFMIPEYFESESTVVGAREQSTS